MSILKSHGSIWKVGGSIVKISDASSNKIKIGQYKYNFVQIGNLLWTSENFREPIATYSKNPNKERYGLMYNKNAIPYIIDMLPDGWRIANRTDWNKLANYRPFNALLDPLDYSGATNETGLSLCRSGWYDASTGLFYNGSSRSGRFYTNEGNYNAEVGASSLNIQLRDAWGSGIYYINMRFCKDV